MPPEPTYKRRQTLKLTGGMVGASLLPLGQRLSASAQTLVDPTRSAAASRTPSRVVIVRTEDRVAGTHQALDLLQPQGINGSVFIKPNYNTGDPAPAATDTPLLEALVQDLQGLSPSSITIGDRSGMARTRQAMQTKGVFDLAERYGLESLVFDELGADQWQYFEAEGTHWQRGFAFARPILEADAVINTCCLKTHRFGGHFTLSLKNSVGMVAKYVPGDDFNYMGDLHSSPHQRLMIAEINQAYTPALVLLDGVEALVNGGPEAGEKVAARVILAGTDRVAVDVVAIGILRLLGTTPQVSQGSVWDLEQIRRAVELGLGASGADQIELVAADEESQSFADQIREQIV